MIIRAFAVALLLLLLFIPHEAEGYYRRRRRRYGGCYNPVNCVVSSWSSWSTCSYPCGSRGTQSRSRTKIRVESCGGSCPFQLSETQRCNIGCSNGGTPSKYSYGGYCRCRPGFTGRCCEGCKEGRTVLNKCGERCQCKQGKLVECTRIRKEFTTMTPSERKKYINAVIVASTDPQYKPRYDKLLTTHRNLFNGIIHEKDNFLPWHRWFILQYENLLREVNCTVTVPYWDWSVVTGTAWRGLPRDLWYTDDSGFGGDGDCVKTGPFRQAVWSLVPSADSVCLARDFNGRPPDSISVQLVLNNAPYQFEEFETALRINFHDIVHCKIGGTMCSDDAASAPEFFLHHAFVDKIWADWQARSTQHKYKHFPNLYSLMPGTWLRPRHVVDLDSQPGGVRVEYCPLPTSVRPNIQTLSVNVLKKIPREKFSCLSDHAMKLFGVKPAEIRKAKKIAKSLEPAVVETVSSQSGATPLEVSLGYRDPFKRSVLAKLV